MLVNQVLVQTCGLLGLFCTIQLLAQLQVERQLGDEELLFFLDVEVLLLQDQNVITGFDRSHGLSVYLGDDVD